MKQTVPSWQWETKKRPPLRHDQCAYCRETGHLRNECPHCRRTAKGSKKFSGPNKERYQCELAIQSLISLAGAESDQGRPGSLIMGPREPTVTMKAGGQSMTFMVDTTAEHSVVTTPVTLLKGRTATIVGATGDMAAHSFCKACSCQLGGHLVTHEFLYLPECPIPLLGRDLLAKLGGTNHLCSQKTCEPHPGKPISSDDGHDHVQGRLMASLFLTEGINKSLQTSKRIP